MITLLAVLLTGASLLLFGCIAYVDELAQEVRRLNRLVQTMKDRARRSYGEVWCEVPYCNGACTKAESVGVGTEDEHDIRNAASGVKS